jgi:uncharacterized SAM-binding protein YcdF (DUF218 family)
MFFLLSKFLGFATQPFTWIIVCFLLSFWLKNKRVKRRFFQLGLVLFFTFSNAFILDEANRVWEIPYQLTDKKLPACGVILGGMSSYDSHHELIQFKEGSDRLWQGVKLLKCDRLEKLIVSGGAGSVNHQELKEADHIEAYLQDIDLADSTFYFENQSKNTHENAMNTKKLFEQHQWSLHITLITSSSHMRRAKQCFEKQGFIVTPYVTNRISGPRKFELDHLLLPNVGTLNAWNKLIHEIIGLWSYQLMGYC